MGKPSKRSKPPADQPGSAGKTEPRKKLETILKWVGGITAVLSLVFGLQRVIQGVSDTRERQRQITELNRVGKEQQDAGNYQAAWASFEEALKKADEGGQIAKLTGGLDAERRRLREAQEDLAMAWLENARAPEGGKFSDVVDKLVPVLDRGVVGASGVRKADLLAHIGWGYFLKERDDPGNLDPERYYRQAVQADPGNPYAHVFWGHWMLWKRQGLEEATGHFSAAVAAGRARPFVRRVQLAALSNLRSESADGELLRAVNDMRKNDEPIDAVTRKDVFSIYYFAFTAGDFQRLTAAVPAGEQIATIQALFYGADFDSSRIPLREAYVATLQEEAGFPDEALKTWRAVRSALPADAGGTLPSRADAAIKRLSRRARAA
jgi:tetratricopeptide (TPR) repeat protein